MRQKLELVGRGVRRYPSSRSECKNPALKAAKAPDMNTRGRIIHRGTSFQVQKEFPLISPPRLCRLKTHVVFAAADENRSSPHILKVGISCLMPISA